MDEICGSIWDTSQRLWIEFEEIEIEATKWEDEVVSEKHEVKVEESELENEIKKPDERSEASSELIVRGKASVYVRTRNFLNFEV